MGCTVRRRHHRPTTQLLRDTARQDRQFGKAIGFRYHDGWSGHFSYDRWMRCADEALTGTGSDVDWYTVRDRALDEVLPGTASTPDLDKGLAPA